MVIDCKHIENDFWKRVYIVRGILFDGELNFEQIKDLGYSESEIKTAATLNKKYFEREAQNKFLEMGVFVGFS